MTYEIIKEQTQSFAPSTRLVLRKQFKTYEQAEQAVMVLVDNDINNYTEGEWLPTYEIKELL